MKPLNPFPPLLISFVFQNPSLEKNPYRLNPFIIMMLLLRFFPMLLSKAEPKNEDEKRSQCITCILLSLSLTSFPLLSFNNPPHEPAKNSLSLTLQELKS